MSGAEAVKAAQDAAAAVDRQLRDLQDQHPDAIAWNILNRARGGVAAAVAALADLDGYLRENHPAQ